MVLTAIYVYDLYDSYVYLSFNAFLVCAFSQNFVLWLLIFGLGFFLFVDCFVDDSRNDRTDYDKCSKELKHGKRVVKYEQVKDKGVEESSLQHHLHDCLSLTLQSNDHSSEADKVQNGTSDHQEPLHAIIHHERRDLSRVE